MDTQITGKFKVTGVINCQKLGKMEVVGCCCTERPIDSRKEEELIANNYKCILI